MNLLESLLMLVYEEASLKEFVLLQVIKAFN